MRNAVDKTSRSKNTLSIAERSEFAFDFDGIDDLTANYIRHPMGILYDMRSGKPVQIDF